MPLRLIFIFLLCLPVQLVSASSIELPDIGDNAGAVSPAEEFRTGEAVIRNIRRAGGILDDPLVQSYLEELSFRLVASNQGDQLFHFFLIKDMDINAFALPGGFIGINAGLILLTKNESELAGVIAHEIAHVTQRHFARRTEETTSNIPVLAAMIAAIILGSQDEQVGQAALATAIAGTAQKQLNFTRANEKEADRIGISLLIKSGFDPQGMADFFESMGKRARLYGDGVPEFLRTHPLTPARITDARDRANQYPQKQVTSSLSYYLLRTRLQVLASDNPAELVKDFQQRLQRGNYQNRESTRYGYALALLAAKKYDRALKQTRLLLKKRATSMSYGILKARIETEARQYNRAIKTYKKLLAIYPNNKSITIFYSKTLIAAGKIRAANKILQQQVSPTVRIPVLYQLLAKTQARLRQPAYSHQSLAEYYYLLGQNHEAIKQLELGLKQVRDDFYLTSRLEARLRELKNEQQQLAMLKTHD